MAWCHCLIRRPLSLGLPSRQRLHTAAPREYIEDIDTKMRCPSHRAPLSAERPFKARPPATPFDPRDDIPPTPLRVSTASVAADRLCVIALVSAAPPRLPLEVLSLRGLARRRRDEED